MKNKKLEYIRNMSHSWKIWHVQRKKENVGEVDEKNPVSCESFSSNSKLHLTKINMSIWNHISTQFSKIEIYSLGRPRRDPSVHEKVTNTQLKGNIYKFPTNFLSNNTNFQAYTKTIIQKFCFGTYWKIANCSAHTWCRNANVIEILILTQKDGLCTHFDSTIVSCWCLDCSGIMLRFTQIDVLDVVNENWGFLTGGNYFSTLWKWTLQLALMHDLPGIVIVDFLSSCTFKRAIPFFRVANLQNMTPFLLLTLYLSAVLHKRNS